MKKRILFTVALILALCAGLKAQEVKRSTAYIQLFGTKYYLHTVQPGETLNAISKAYNVSMQEILIQNKGAATDLKTGSVLKIPVMAEIKTAGTQQEFIYHTVEKKQSLYSICKQYGLPESEIIKYNPGVKNGLKAGSILKIPVGEAPKPDKQDTEFIYHTVKQNETLYSMSTLYGVDMEMLVKYNPKLKNKPVPGQIIRVPKIAEYMQNNDVETALQPVQGPESEVKDLKDYTDCNTYVYKTGTVFKVALLLPLNINDNLTLSAQMKSNPDKVQLYKNSNDIFEFYLGTLMALKEFQREGKSAEFYVYDTERSLTTTQNILNNPELKTMDLIIGPLYTDNVAKASQWARANKIAMVSPFAQNKELLNENPYLFQYTPSGATLVAGTADYFASLGNASVIVIHNGTKAELDKIQLYKNNLSRSYFSNKNVPDMPFKEIDYRSGGINRVAEALSLYKTDIILIPSTNEVFITNVINQLATIQRNTRSKIILFGSKTWENYGNLDTEFLQSMNFHYCEPSYINYNDPKVKDFISEFKSRYNVEPGLFGINGYDCAKYFLNKLATGGKYFEFCVSDKQHGLGSEIEFKRVNDNGGFENQASQVLKYGEDFNLEKVNK